MAQILEFPREVVEDEDYLPMDKFEGLKRYIKELQSKYDIPYLVGCIYDLFQEYILSEEQERELYEIVDPKERFNECSKYWEWIDENPLMNYLT